MNYRHYTLAENIPTFFPCPEILQETKVKGTGLIDLVEEISKQPSVLTVPLLAAFSQTYSENGGKQQTRIIRKPFLRGTMCTVSTKGSMDAEEITVIKKTLKYFIQGQEERYLQGISESSKTASIRASAVQK